MKNLYVFLLLFYANFFLKAQTPPNHQSSTLRAINIVFEPTPEMLDLSKFSNIYQTINLNNDRFVINIQFHGILDANGASQFPIGEQQALAILARLNEVFNVHNIFFKYRGFNSAVVIDPNIYYGLYGNIIKQQFINENKYDFNSINWFIHDKPHNYLSGINSNTSTDIYACVESSIMINNGNTLTADFIPQLMGHCLGLLNIESRTYGYRALTQPASCLLPDIINAYNYLIKPTFYPAMADQQENVARSGINCNATIKGDFVADTQACFILFKRNFCNNITPANGHTNFVTWNTDVAVVDQVGEPYVCTTNEGNNFMSVYNNRCGANGIFTTGQIKRIKEYIEGNMDNIFRTKLNVFEDDTPDISVLYEPFLSNQNNGNVGNNMYASSRTFATNSSNTGANVWNCGPFAMRFQTGFDCEFSSPTGTVNQTIYQQYNTSTATYVGVKIPILGPQIYTNYAPVCFSSFEPFTSGDVKSLNNLGSGIYTQEQLNEIKASDPRLYEQLQSGKYHIITKQTDSGFIDQKVIYKN